MHGYIALISINYFPGITENGNCKVWSNESQNGGL